VKLLLDENLSHRLATPSPYLVATTMIATVLARICTMATPSRRSRSPG
jgi:hypothetical protein